MVDKDGFDFSVFINILGIIGIVFGYGYFMFVYTPNRNEQRQMEAQIAMGVQDILENVESGQGLPERDTGELEIYATEQLRVQGDTVVLVAGDDITPTPNTRAPGEVETVVSAAPSAVPIVATGLPSAWGYRQSIDPMEHCFDCEVYAVDIMVTHYWPNAGTINCWQYNDETQYCDSATTSELPWEYFVGIGAACPYDWPLGSWVEIPNYGTVLCVDRGSMICENAVCEVDILSKDIGAIDKTVQQSKVYISWKP